MAAPQRRPQYRPSTKRPVRRRNVPGAASRRAPGWARRHGERIGQAFTVLVVPVLLMLGSVYVHTVAVAHGGEVARLEEEKARAEDEGERLEVQITKLSEPKRIRTLAREKLQMRDPDSKDLGTGTQGSDGKDVANEGGEKGKGTGE